MFLDNPLTIHSSFNYIYDITGLPTKNENLETSVVSFFNLFSTCPTQIASNLFLTSPNNKFSNYQIMISTDSQITPSGLEFNNWREVAKLTTAASTLESAIQG